MFSVSLVVLAVIAYTELFYRQTLFDKSVQWIPVLQSRATTAEINWWKLYTDVGLVCIEAIPIGFTYLKPEQRRRCLYYVFTFVVITTIMNITKLSYADPRPYWVSPDVQAFKCSSTFGNPSGHSEMSMAISLILWLDFQKSYP